MKKSLIIIFAVFMLGTITSCDVSGSDSNTEGVPSTPGTPDTPIDVNEYTITFHSNNGQTETSTQTVLKESSFILTANSFTKNGYGFTGWSKVKDSGIIDYVNQEEITSITNNINLYANWEFGDTQNPIMTKVEQLTRDINTSETAQEVKFKVWISDDVSLSRVYYKFQDPSGNDFDPGFENLNGSNFSGDKTGGVVIITQLIPSNSLVGEWSLSGIVIIDESGKSISYDKADNSIDPFSFTFTNTGN